MKLNKTKVSRSDNLKVQIIAVFLISCLNFTQNTPQLHVPNTPICYRHTR